MMWNLLLQIKSLVKANPGIKWLVVKIRSGKFEVTANDESPPGESILIVPGSVPVNKNAGTIILCKKPFCVEILCDSALLPKKELHFFSLYLPYALLPYFARVQQKTFSISHFAQTLDGRIASHSCESKWIGNDENLVHAHRMRALCEAILIGSKTLVIDNPQLNVRHVDGEDPVKVVIGGDNLSLAAYKAVNANTLIFSQNHVDKEIPVKTISLTKEKGKYHTHGILKELFDQNIHSVYIEGGAITSSHFLSEQSVDQVQIHFAPKILGSGTTGFSFSGIDKMEEALSFESHRFVPMGDGIMFIGEPK